jgi:hypothetical protein
MALYRDPAAAHRPRPSIVRDLLRIPAKIDNHQIENQATCVLGWLVDRSPVFARELVALFVGDAVEVVEPIGARTWISLAKPGGGAVFPDLSIEAAAASLQLLVEVKVGSEFAVYEDGTLQPDYYRQRWLELPPGPEAAARAVGTLTRPGGTTPVDLARLRARDVTWSQVRDLLRDVLDAGALDASVALVAESFLEALVTQIAVDPPDPATLAGWLAAHRDEAYEVANGVASLLRADGVTTTSGRAFVGRRVRFDDVAGAPLFARVYAAKAGSGLTLAGWPDAIIVGIERDANGALDQPTSLLVEEAGFLRVKDTDGFWLHRQFWPLDDEPSVIANGIAEALRATGLLPRRG